jgi:hypothetical protein
MQLLKLFIAINFCFQCFGQSKKEQVEILSIRIDSLELTNQKTILELSLKKQFADSLERILFSKEQLLISNKNIKDTLTSIINNLIRNNDSLIEQIKSLKSTLSIKDKIEVQLNLKIDSLSNIVLHSINDIKEPSRAFISSELVKNINGQDARNLSNDERRINFYINDLLIDTYFDFGAGEYSSEKMEYYLQSDLSQKTYSIRRTDSLQLYIVTLTLFFDGEERKVWDKTYFLNSYNQWVKEKCEGECD